jgi:hypothetical protein
MPPILRMIVRMIVAADSEGRGLGQMTTGTIAGMIRAKTGGSRRVEGHVVVANQMGVRTSNSQMATTVISQVPSMMPRHPIR